MSRISQKIISAWIVFVIMISYSAQTMQVLATDGFTAITNGFSSKSEVQLNSYFGETGNTELIRDVNQTAIVTFEITPTKVGKGFLKNGTISAIGSDGSQSNFRFVKINHVEIDEPEKDLVETENQVLEKNSQETGSNQLEPKEEEESQDETDIQVVEVQKETDISRLQLTSRANESRDNEDENESFEELSAKDFEIEIKEDNQIQVQNVIYPTKIEAEIEYRKEDIVEVANLYQKIDVTLDGTYVNKKLEKVEIQEKNEITVGWTYHKDIEVRGEYTKFSAFKQEANQGIVVENKIIVTRDNLDEKFLPVKQMIVEIDVPDINGNQPKDVQVQATKLMASKGEELTQNSFSVENWNYDAQNKKITINVTNETDGKANLASGSDEYIVNYRYNDYLESEKAVLGNNIKATVEEYSSNNIVTDKEFHEDQEIAVTQNELLTYNISTTDKAVNKGKINANYNSEDVIYQTNFKTTVGVNILTSDLVEEIKVNASKEVYVKEDNSEVDALSDITYRKINFQYYEIKPLLENDGSIEIQNTAGEVLVTLNKENVTSDENCQILLEGTEHGVFVVFKNVAINGNVSIEFEKEIGKSTYSKAEFCSFKKIKSYAVAEFKCKDIEYIYSMNEISVEKEFSESKTNVNLVLGNEMINTTNETNSLEMKIELNNHSKKSDLFVNPSFEIVFPKPIQNIEVSDIKLAYENGLQIANYEVIKAENNEKLKIDLTGTEQTFCESTQTNGTNLVVNIHFDMPENTKKAQKQIVLYYYNQGVTNYESETEWKMTSPKPEGILRDTNGISVAPVYYQVPSKLTLSNSIINYDGQGSKVSSYYQGEKTEEIKIGAPETVATMELVAMNNTGNNCTDVVLMGKVPFKGNKSVITKEDLQTTVNTFMANGITANDQNANSAKIYYSENENPTKDLDNEENGWIQEVEDVSKVKAFLIVIEGDMAPDTILKYTYEFQIPENLTYNDALFGSFGGFYYNNGINVISYETAEADKVGICVESAIPITMELNVDETPNNKLEGKYLNYTLVIQNKSAETLNNIKITNPTPFGTKAYRKLSDNSFEGNNVGYEKVDNLEWNIEELLPNETVACEYELRVSNGMGGKTVESIAYAEMGDAKINSNTVVTEIEDSLFGMKLTSDAGKEVVIGTKIYYELRLANLKDYDLENVEVNFVLPKEIEYTELNVIDSEEKVRYDTKDNIVTYKLGELAKNSAMELRLTGKVVSSSMDETEMYVTAKSEKIEERSSQINMKFNTPQLETYFTTNVEGDVIRAGDALELILNLKNAGETRIDEIDITGKLSDILYDVTEHLGDSQGDMLTCPNVDGIIDMYISAIEPGEVKQYKITGTVKEDVKKNSLSQRFNVTMEDAVTFKTDKLKLNVDTGEEAINEYSISGNVWIDADKDGLKSSGEKGFSDAKVNLLKNGEVIQIADVDNAGNYEFSGLEEGKYDVAFDYDDNNYVTCENSSEYALTAEKSIANGITVTDADIEEVSLGVQEKDNFDFEVTETLSNATAFIGDEQTVYNYEDADLAKIEIDPFDISKASVKFEYKIVVKNTGNIPGRVTSIKDYLPAGMKLEESESNGWTNGIDGNLYNDSLKNTILQPGEKKELTLVTYKKFNSENTGILSNKVQIAYTESDSGIQENSEGNFATQETIITVTQGLATRGGKIVTTIISVLIIVILTYGIKEGRIEIKIGQFKIGKKFYK